MIAYKALLHESMAIKVDAHYTSPKRVQCVDIPAMQIHPKQGPAVSLSKLPLHTPC